MVICEDTRQQNDARGDKHASKHAWWASHGVTVIARKLDAGDYMSDGCAVTVDTKRSVAEIAQNINGREHDRFKRECQRAADAGLTLVVLVENRNGYRSVGDVRRWTNEHCAHCAFRLRRACNVHDARVRCAKHGTRKPIQGPRLAKAMRTMGERYGVEFMFCSPEDSARIVCDLLGVPYDGRP